MSDRCFEEVEISDEKEVQRNSIGGYPILSKSQTWPRCPVTGEKMVLFLQFDISQEMELPFETGAHISVFMSPSINEIPSFDFSKGGKPLPDRFWTSYENHFKVFFNRSNETERVFEKETRLTYKKLVLSAGCRNGKIKVGGRPDWLQPPELPYDKNGHDLEFIFQIPENYRFAKTVEAPPQPDSFSKSEYCLFLGNQSYFFASMSDRHEEAVWISVQN